MEHINRLWTAIVHGVTESAAYHTVALIHGEPKAQELATGTAVSFRGHQFIVTAAHVIRDWTDEIYMIPRPEGPYAIRPTPKPYGPWGTRRLRERIKPKILARHVSGHLDDLAAILPTPFAELRLLRFHELDRTRTASPIGTKIMIFGFPVERTSVAVLPGQPPAGVVVPLVQFSIVLDPAPYAMANFDPERHLLLQFERTSGPEDVLSNPLGLSGAGAWTAPPWEEGAIWDPRTIELVGIQVAWYPSQRVQMVTRVERLIAFLDQVTENSVGIAPADATAST